MQDIKNIKVIIGLGNPGELYTKTYHNVGQLFTSSLIKRETLSIKHKLFLASKFMFHDSCFMIHVVRPLTFMNESGKTVLAALRYFSSKKEKIKPEEILVVQDDSDIELGNYKISFGRGSAGHKGVESIIRSLKTKNFWRLRIGIRNEKSKVNPSTSSGLTLSKVERVKSQKSKVRIRAEDLVLKKIKKEDWLALQQVFKCIEENIF